jgi:hypothetical protein
MVYRFYDATDFLIRQNFAYFGTGPNGRESANIANSYEAGWAGAYAVQQDRLNSQVGVNQIPADAISDAWLPWNTVPVCGSAVTKTYTATGTYNWKAIMIWGFPEKSKTITFTQVVDP